MKDSKIRLLKANEIECRVSVIKENGLSLLLYKDARVDQKILDEMFGAFGWKRSHQSIEGNLYCTVEIFDEDTATWVGKQDVGTTGYAEKEKSQASDSFKRACFNWGIGRELYSAPFIWIPAEKTSIQKKNDKLFCNDRFSVVAIGYNDDREIISLSIANRYGEVVYEQKADAAQKEDAVQKADTGKKGRKQGKKQETPKTISASQMQSLEAELQRTGVDIETVRERYQFGQPEQMSPKLYQKVMSALKQTKSIA
jgi:hypothetical protein